MSEAPAVHVIGAGLAGLAAAAALAAAGRRVVLYEAGPHAGGRCRSYFDNELGCRIDNGNHLLLSGNESALSYLDLVGARDRFIRPPEPVFPFVDLVGGERWALRPNRGPLPWWILSAARRVPGTGPSDYFSSSRLRHAGAAATVAEVLGREQVLYRRLWEPLAVAALNTAATLASARLFGRLLAETLGNGGGACLPMVPGEGLSESFVDPALERLRAHGAEIRFGARVRALQFAAEQVVALAFEDATRALGAGESAILAVPAAGAARLVPGLTVPDAYAPIVNAHYRLTPPPDMPLFLGIVGGVAQWVFRKRDVISVTVSAADAIVDEPAERLRASLWRDVTAACRLAAQPTPPARIVKERRATFLASPSQLSRRPGTPTRWANLFLAGDYVDTGLPATMEGAIRSGLVAAKHVQQRRMAAASASVRKAPVTSAQTAAAAEP